MIARVHGIATVAFCQLVASCDLAVAADTARFATLGVPVGSLLFDPDEHLVAHGQPQGRNGDVADRRTDRRATRPRSRPDQSRGAGDRTGCSRHGARRTDAAKSPLTLAIGKEAFYRQAEMGLDDAYAYASEVMTRNMLARDAATGIDAFLGKRQPVWTGT